MAVNEIQVGRQNAVLHKLLAMKEGAPSPILAPEIIPVMVLESDRPEWAFLAGELLAWGTQSASGNVTNRAIVELRNPAGSGTLCVIERIIVSGGNASSFLVGIRDLSPRGSGSNSQVREGRVIPGHPTCALASALSTTSSDSFVGLQLANNPVGTPIHLQIPLIIPPGMQCTVEDDVVNTSIRVNFVWRERTLEPSETR